MESKIKATFNVIVTNWIRLYLNKDDMVQFPLDIVELIVNIFLYEGIKFLKFSSKYKLRKIVLTDDDKCASCRYTSTFRHVFVDCDAAIAKSISLWRIKVLQHRQSILINQI